MLNGMKIKRGSLVQLKKDLGLFLNENSKYQISMWEMDHYFLRDRFSLKLINAWVQPDDVCIVVKQDHTGLVILNPRGNVGWIGKERLEIIK